MRDIVKIMDSLTEEQKTSPDKPDVPLPEGYVWTRSIFGRWGVIGKNEKGVPYLDPAYETYWSM